MISAPVFNGMRMTIQNIKANFFKYFSLGSAWDQQVRSWILDPTVFFYNNPEKFVKQKSLAGCPFR
jgi:hypothetical protein